MDEAVPVDRVADDEDGRRVRSSFPQERDRIFATDRGGGRRQRVGSDLAVLFRKDIGLILRRQPIRPVGQGPERGEIGRQRWAAAIIESSPVGMQGRCQVDEQSSGLMQSVTSLVRNAPPRMTEESKEISNFRTPTLPHPSP